MEWWNIGFLFHLILIEKHRDSWNKQIMDRKNINRGFKQLRVWQDAVSFTSWPIKYLPTSHLNPKSEIVSEWGFRSGTIEAVWEWDIFSKIKSMIPDFEREKAKIITTPLKYSGTGIHTLSISRIIIWAWRPAGSGRENSHSRAASYAGCMTCIETVEL